MKSLEDFISILAKDIKWEKEHFLKRNEFLCFAETKDTSLYLIESGSFRIYYATDEAEYTVRLGYSGEIIAALDSLFTDDVSNLNIQAIKASKILSITKKQLYNFLDENQERYKYWSQLLEQLIVSQIEREMDLLITDPKERYERILNRSPRLFEEIPLKHIASYLRMTPETLSRLRKP